VLDVLCGSRGFPCLGRISFLVAKGYLLGKYFKGSHIQLRVSTCFNALDVLDEVKPVTWSVNLTKTNSTTPVLGTLSANSGFDDVELDLGEIDAAHFRETGRLAHASHVSYFCVVFLNSASACSVLKCIKSLALCMNQKFVDEKRFFESINCGTFIQYFKYAEQLGRKTSSVFQLSFEIPHFLAWLWNYGNFFLLRGKNTVFINRWWNWVMS